MYFGTSSVLEFSFDITNIQENIYLFQIMLFNLFYSLMLLIFNFSHEFFVRPRNSAHNIDKLS